MALTPHGEQLNPVSKQPELDAFVRLLSSIECSNCQQLKPAYNILCRHCWSHVPKEIKDKIIGAPVYHIDTLMLFEKAIAYLAMVELEES